MSQEIITQAIPDINFDVKKTKSFFHDNKLHIELFLESSTNVHCTQCLSSDIRIRGSKKRKIKHSNAAFNDILIIFNARQYICTECNINFKERLPEAYDKRVSLAIDHRVYEQLGDVRKSLSQIADDLDISPQYVGKILDELQSPRRLNLPKFLSIDEVYTKINSSSKYSCILFNPKESELIDMLPTRFKKDLRTYFNSIPKEERLNVKYVCIDMYEPYKEIIEEFLPSAVVSIDSFHVVKNLVDAVQSIRKRVQGAFANDYINRSNYRLFKRNNGLLVQRNIDFKKLFAEPRKITKHLSMTASQIIESMINTDNELNVAYYLYHEYLDFNNAGQYSAASTKIYEFIDKFKATGIPELVKFGKMMNNWAPYIINSYIRFTKKEFDKAGNERLIIYRHSNAKIENFNRFVKDLIRKSNGMRNFERLRKRMMLYKNKDTPFNKKQK